MTRQALSPGDVLGVGPYRFRFEESLDDATSPPVSGAPFQTQVGGEEVVLEDDLQAAPGDPRSSSGAEVLARVDTRALSASDVVGDTEGLRRKLRTFYRFVDAFGTLLDLDQVLDRVVDTVFEIFEQTERAFVVLAEPGSGELTPRAVRKKDEDDDDRITISRTIVEEAMREGRGILTADAAEDERFGQAASIINFKIRSAMCVPLVSRNETYGVIHVDTSDQRAHFSEDDLYILAGIGAQAAVAIENATLHQELVRNQVREHDFRLASEVQRSFLPKSVPEVPRYDFFAHYSPAYEVGGDFYDFIRLPGERVAVILGDVPGKGFSAALMMAKLVSDIRHTALTVEDSRAVVGRVNMMLARSESEKAFVTLVYLDLDPATGECTIVNAGHMAPMIRRADGAIEEPDSAGSLPLGVLDDTEYGRDVAQLQPGDCLFVYTDGITEARSGPASFLGHERLQACVKAGPTDIVGLGGHILSDVEAFVGDTVQSDDITLVGFGRTA